MDEKNKYIYKEVPPSQITPQAKNNNDEDINLHFNNIIDEIWIKLKKPNQYQTGYKMGKLNSFNLDLLTFYEVLVNALKETLISEYKENKQTTETLSSYFILLENVLKLLTLEVSKNDIDTTNLIVKYHGFINGYMQEIINKIKEKYETEKYQQGIMGR